jgi:hypothetical protein
MSSPTPGSDPNSPPPTPEGQSSWGAPQQGQPQGYGQAQGYQPAPSYENSPSAYGAAAGARPPQVLTAAILGFVVALFLLLGSFVFFAAASIPGFFVFFAIVYLALAALNVWGGVVAIQGKNSTILKIAGLITAGLSLLGLIIYLSQGHFDVFSVLAIAVGLGIFFLLNQPASKQFFAARGGK